MKLTTAGLLFLIIVWGSVISLAAYCFTKVLRPKKNQDSDGT